MLALIASLLLLMPSTDSSDRVVIAAARESMNVFAAYVLDLDQAMVHKRLQRHLGDHDDCHTELPRGHGKTVQLSGRCAFEIGRNPDIRIKYVQQSDVEAARTTELIKNIIESEKYRRVFPHVAPDKRLWGKQEFRVQRGKLSRDATVQAAGIFGRAGGRWDLLVGDDICDMRNAIQQAALREQVKDFWANNWAPMADETTGSPRVWTVGTPWHVDDITADWRAYHGSRGSLMRCPVVNYNSPWPESWLPDRLKAWREKHGPIAFGRAYELNPVSAEQIIFDAAWLDDSLYTRIPAWDASNGQMVATVDFAFTEANLKNDPDYSVCLIGWAARNGHVYVSDIVRKRSTFPDFKRAAIAKCVACGVTRMIGEDNGPQSGLVQQMNVDAPFPVTGMGRDRDKPSRAAEKQAFVESGRFHLKAKRDETGVLRPIESLQVVYDEMTTFPASGHDDTVDTAIDMMEVVGTPIKTGQKSKRVRNTRLDPSRMYA